MICHTCFHQVYDLQRVSVYHGSSFHSRAGCQKGILHPPAIAGEMFFLTVPYIERGYHPK